MTNQPGPTPDQQAAHAFLSELRTRIATQPLPYQHGIEERALESLYGVFEQARTAMNRYPGCEQFANATTAMLNTVLRPVTGKWHRAKEEGRLLSRDGGDAFRADLADVQDQLRKFAEQMGQMAYGTRIADELVRGPLAKAELDACLKPFAFGIPPDLATSGGIEPATARTINEKEAASVAAHRRQTGRAADGDDGVGLAFSGGGIRSAVFCLGVTQVLAARGLLSLVDYLSTVSGGGYTGSFLSTQLGSGVPMQQLGAPHGPDPMPIQTLRRHARFLVGRGNWESFCMFLETVLGMLFNWCVPLVVIAGTAALAVLWKRWQPAEAVWMQVAAVAAVLTTIAALIFFRLERAKIRSARPAGWAMAGGASVLTGALVVWLLDSAFGWIVPGLQGGSWTSQQLGAAIESWPKAAGVSWLGTGFLVSMIPTALRYLPLLGKPFARKVVVVLALAVGGLFVPLLAVLVFYVLFALGAVREPGETIGSGLVYLAAAIAVAGGLVAIVLNINTTGPHRLYRRGLKRTFVDAGQRHARPVPLAALDPEHRAPYHLVNTTVNLPSSTDIRLRERGCDFFLFSKHWTGSPVIGYQPTATWEMDAGPVDLATAMAVSGAAFSSNMGLGSIAPLRALLAFLNVRLGYWIRRPPKAGVRKVSWNHPGFLCLLYEMTGLGLSEKRPWLNLSDGGHIENLAVYELLRRRCKFVLCVDGEADPDFTFHGLMTLVRHAQIDLGVVIEPDLRDLRPDPQTKNSRSHYHLCRIRYPERDADGEPKIGLLLYVKLSVTGNESELLRRYRGNHASFPHQTTLDQFFDEEQFEAYRQLGVHIAEGLFARSLMDRKESPATVREWFSRLAHNLLVAAG